MTVTLGLNISSLRSQRQLGKTSNELSTVFERLSSGQRINRASDDAAGLAIADSLRTDQRVYAQAIRNLSDGISILSIADSAIENLSSIVVRLQELAEQSANGVLGNTQRAALNEEAQSLSLEYSRIARTTEFNSIKVFTGDQPNIHLQAGTGANAVISASVGGAIGTGSFENEQSVLSALSGASSIGDANNDGNIDLLISDTTGLHMYLGTGNGTFTQGADLNGDTAFAKHNTLADFNNDGNLDAVFTNGGTEFYVQFGNGDGTFQGIQTFATTSTNAGFVSTGDVNGDGNVDLAVTHNTNFVHIFLGNGDGTFTETSSYTAGSVANVSFADINGDGFEDTVNSWQVGSTSVRLSNGDGTFGADNFLQGLAQATSSDFADLNGDGNLDVYSATNGGLLLFMGNGDGTFGSVITLSPTYSLDAEARDVNSDGIMDLISSGSGGFSILLGTGGGNFEAESTFALTQAEKIHVGDFDSDGVIDVLTGGATLTFGLASANTVAGVASLLDFSLSSQSGARQALPLFQQKLDQLASQRGEIGSYMARINVAQNVLSVSKENFAVAESRIRDADIAAESANLVRLNILQQASSAILAQANQQPALALRLLQADS